MNANSLVVKKLNSLQVCRGIAASLVVLLHYGLLSNVYFGYKPLFNFFRFGWAGVDFFFVLSGFIISYINREKIGNFLNLKPYLLKRIIRIYPIYWPLLLLTTVLYFIFGRSNTSIVPPIHLHYFIESALLASYKYRPILTVAWTLVFEVFFYLIYSVMFINKNAGKALFIAWAIAIFVNLYIVPFSTTNHFIMFLFNFHNLEFLLGCVACWIFCNHKKYIIAPVKLSIFGALLFLYAGLCLVYQHVSFFILSPHIIQYAMSIASFLIILGLTKHESSKPIRIPKIGLLIGDASYDIYLIHPLILGVLIKVFQMAIPQNWHGVFHMLTMDSLLFIAYLASAFGGILYYKYYDVPVRHYLRKVFLKRSGEQKHSNHFEANPQT